ncbi:hypothetical protein MKQ30_003884 [Escherichia coli]|nr:hypothetical protein [Escherichia coli]
MAIQITQLHQADIFGYIADMLETARLLSSLEKGEQLAFELIYILRSRPQGRLQTSRGMNKQNALVAATISASFTEWRTLQCPKEL